MGRSSSTGRLRGGRVCPGGRGAPRPGGGTGEPAGVRAAGAEPRGGSRRASAGRRGADRHGRGSAGHITRAGRGGGPRPAAEARTRGRTGVRGRGGGCLRGAPRRRLRDPATRREARSGAADGGHGDGGATASPVSGCRARPRWSPPGPPRDDTYGFDGAAAAAESRGPCAAAAAGVAPRRRSTMRPGSSVLRVIAGPDGHPLGRVHPVSRPSTWGSPGLGALDTARGGRACRPVSCRRDPVR